jgi:hypothetical protein
MTEPFFGTASPLWAGSPSPGFGWLQTPIAAAHRPLAQVGGPLGLTQPPISTPLLLDQPGLGPGPASGPGTGLGNPSFMSGITIAPTALASSPYMTYFGPEVTTSVTAPALLAAVAARRGQPMGPTNDQEIEDFVYDALELLPGTNEIEVRSEGGRVLLTGNRRADCAGAGAQTVVGGRNQQNGINRTESRERNQKRVVQAFRLVS